MYINVHAGYAFRVSPQGEGTIKRALGLLEDVSTHQPDVGIGSCSGSACLASSDLKHKLQVGRFEWFKKRISSIEHYTPQYLNFGPWVPLSVPGRGY